MTPRDYSLAAAAVSARRCDLDWLRVIAFALLIFYHVGMFYVTWDFHVKSTYASPFIEPAMLVVNPWRLMLLFFISGLALRFAMDGSSLRALLPRRTLRLLLPIVFGMLVVVVPQAYFELRFKGEIGPAFWPFYLSYLSPRQEFSIITPTWNHLWYVVYIMVYTLVVAAMLPVLRRLDDGHGERLFSWLEGGANHWRLLLVPALPFVIYRLVLDPFFPTTHTLIGDWATHAHALTMFIFGFIAARSPAFWRAIDKALRNAIVLAVALAVMLFWARLNIAALASDEMVRQGVPALRVFYAWVTIAALLGLAQRYLNRPGKALTYLTEAIFPYYILHQTLILAIGYALLVSRLPAWSEALAVTLGTVAGCAMLHEIIRRVPLLRPLFGLRYRRRVAAVQSPVILPASRV